MPKIYIPGCTGPYNPECGLGGVYNLRSFSDIFPDADSFSADYEASGLAVETSRISTKNTKVLYFLLASRYRNSRPKMDDENRFKAAIFSIIFEYGPTWEARLKAQHELRKLLDDPDGALLEGATAIYNHSINPSRPPAVDAFEPLPTVNDQNANKWKKGKLEAYATLMDSLKTDVTESFLSRFDKLFREWLEPDGNLLFPVKEN
jgi:hypothetical protein